MRSIGLDWSPQNRVTEILSLYLGFFCKCCAMYSKYKFLLSKYLWFTTSDSRKQDCLYKVALDSHRQLSSPYGYRILTEGISTIMSTFNCGLQTVCSIKLPTSWIWEGFLNLKDNRREDSSGPSVRCKRTGSPLELPFTPKAASMLSTDT
jgi:hypothetical protein